MLAQTLQDLVVVPDGRGLILTRSKVALQLKGGRKATSPNQRRIKGKAAAVLDWRRQLRKPVK